MAEKDVDEQFAAMMAHWDEEARGLDPFGDPATDRDGGDVDHLDPDDEPGDSLRDRPGDTGTPAGPVEHVEEADVEPPVVGSAWRRHNPQEEEEHFEPPPPAPLPSSEDKHFWTMLGALVGGPLLFLYLLLFNRDGNGWWMTFALLVSVAGFVLLVLRQPNHRDEDDDGIRL